MKHKTINQVCSGKHRIISWVMVTGDRTCITVVPLHSSATVILVDGFDGSDLAAEHHLQTADGLIDDTGHSCNSFAFMDHFYC